MTDKCYSIDEEDFCYGSVEELMEYLHTDELLGHIYYEADAIGLTHEDNITIHQVDSILENFDEMGYDWIGEHYDTEYSEVSKEAKSELHKLLLGWAKKNVPTLRYYLVKNVVEKTLTEEDISAHTKNSVL